jgi:hypothetical protein
MGSNDIDRFLMGGGGKAAKFDNVGDYVEGSITNVELQQQTSMEDNTPLTWSDGSPRMQLVVTLATDLRDGEEDDGSRRIYAKGGTYEVAEGTGRSMKDAIAEAVKKAGAKTIAEGGVLKIGFTGLGKKTNRGYSAPKLFKASYKEPVASVPASDLFDDD